MSFVKLDNKLWVRTEAILAVREVPSAASTKRAAVLVDGKWIEVERAFATIMDVIAPPLIKRGETK